MKRLDQLFERIENQLLAVISVHWLLRRTLMGLGEGILAFTIMNVFGTMTYFFFHNSPLEYAHPTQVQFLYVSVACGALAFMHRMFEPFTEEELRPKKKKKQSSI